MIFLNLCLFRESEREREREEKKEGCARETSIGYLLYTPGLGVDYNPRYCPDQNGALDSQLVELCPTN